MSGFKNAIFVIGYYPPVVGGAEKKTQRLANELVSRGWKITVLTKGAGGLPEMADEDGVNVIRIGDADGRGFFPRAVFYVKLVVYIWKLRGEYEIIHNFLFSSISAICAAAGKFLKKRVVISLGGVGKLGGWWDVTGLGRAGGIKRWIVERGGVQFVVPNRDVKDEIKKTGISEKRIYCLPNPVDTFNFSPELRTNSGGSNKLRSRLCGNGRLFVFVGRLSPEKRLERIIAAWPGVIEAVPDAFFVVVGTGAMLNCWAEMAKRTGIGESIVFEGEKPDVINYYRAADFFILPSQSEGMSNALLEAMACGVPPIVGNIGGTDMVVDGETGFKVYDADNPAVWTRVLLNACSLRAEEKAKLSVFFDNIRILDHLAFPAGS